MHLCRPSLRLHFLLLSLYSLVGWSEKGEFFHYCSNCLWLLKISLETVGDLEGHPDSTQVWGDGFEHQLQNNLFVEQPGFAGITILQEGLGGDMWSLA